MKYSEIFRQKMEIARYGQSNISAAYQKHLIGSLKLFYKMVFSRVLQIDQLFPKRTAHTLPKYLNKEEVKRILSGVTNLKHKAILSTLYGCGLRLSELINLKIEDVDSKNEVITIRQARGKKDRQVMLPKSLLPLLR